MGKLDNLEKELYGSGSDDLKKRMRQRILFPRTLRRLATAWTTADATLQQDPEVIGKNKKLTKWFSWSLAGFLILIAGAFAFLYFGTRGQEAKITIHDRGPIEAGELVTIPISFQNVSKTVLQEVELTIILPEHSLINDGGLDRLAPLRIIKKFNDLRPGEEGVFEISVRMFGAEQEKKEVQAFLVYRPQSLRARFTAKATKEFEINRVPLAISLDIPETLTKGQDVTARIRYTSTAPHVFQNMWVRLEYPPGFSFVSADPKPSVSDAIWNIGAIAAGTEGLIVVQGVMNAEEGEIKAFRAELGVFNELTKEWRLYQEVSSQAKIEITPLSIQGFLSGVRNYIIVPGETLGLTLRYKNNTSSTLRNVTARAFIESDVIDFNSFSIEHGVFDFLTKAVVWNSASAEELGDIGPGESGELRFTVNTRERPIVRGEQDKNLLVRLRSEITPAVIPSELKGTDLSSGDSVSFKVKSKVVFAGKSLYKISLIVNSGPLPPRVGQETTYTIFWEVRNFTNDLKNAVVIGKISPNVKWVGTVFPQDSRISFDSGTGEVRWIVGDIKAGTGVISPAPTVAFQVSVTPSGNDLGKPMQLIGESVFSGLDTFINESSTVSIGPLTTELREEPGVPTSSWTVVK